MTSTAQGPEARPSRRTSSASVLETRAVARACGGRGPSPDPGGTCASRSTRASRGVRGQDRRDERLPRERATGSRPTALRPSTKTSPGPRPAKQTTRWASAPSSGPSWTAHRRRQHAEPARRPTSDPRRPRHDARRVATAASSAGIHQSTQTSPGWMSTTPPPPRRRRTASAPGLADAGPRRDWRLPSTTRDASACTTVMVGSRRRRSAVVVVELGGAAGHEARGRNGAHNGCGSGTWRHRHQGPSGTRGSKWSRQPSSSIRRSPFCMLWRLQAATTFVHSCEPPATARHDVVDGVGVLEAVRAAVAVAQQQRAPRQGGGSHPRRQLDHLVQADDRRDLHDQRGAAADLGLVGDGDGFGPSGQHQDDGAALAHQLQRLEGGVEQEDTAHGRTSPGSPNAHRAASTRSRGVGAPVVP